jgi:DNA-binding HxlR family transcriptional regulator
MTPETRADYDLGSATRMALDCLAHKWTVLIILELKQGPLRFTQLRKAVSGVTPQVLTQTLRELQRNGMLLRRYFPEVPPRVEYGLTDLGYTLCEPVNAIRAWAEKHGPAIIKARESYDADESQIATTDARRTPLE